MHKRAVFVALDLHLKEVITRTHPFIQYQIISNPKIRMEEKFI